MSEFNILFLVEKERDFSKVTTPVIIFTVNSIYSGPQNEKQYPKCTASTKILRTSGL